MAHYRRRVQTPVRNFLSIFIKKDRPCVRTVLFYCLSVADGVDGAHLLDLTGAAVAEQQDDTDHHQSAEDVHKERIGASHKDP